MRKTVIFLSILAFASCLTAGILLAQTSLNSIKGQNDSNSLANPFSSYQQNILLIHIDDLQKNQPTVNSVWGIILYFPEPKIIFQPIYPSPFGTETFPLATFQIGTTKNVNPQFIQQVSLLTQMTWEKYILVDHHGLSFLITGLLVGEPFSSSALEENSDIISIEREYFSKICHQMAVLEQNGFQQIRWKDLIPNHWHSNLFFDDAMAYWARLSSPESSIKCEVFGE